MLAATLLAAVALAAPFPDTIQLPNGWLPEGIATGEGNTFYSGSRANGAVYAGDLRTGAGDILVPGQTGRVAVGLKFRGGNLYVAGGATGQIYVFDAATGADVDVEQAATAGATFINDVTVTRTHAYFTDSSNPVLYVYDRAAGTVSTLQLSGDYEHVDGFNLNGIASTPNGKRLVAVNSTTGALYKIDPATGVASLIDAPSMTQGDGILLRGKKLYVVRNRLNQVVKLRLNPTFTTATQRAVITNPSFDVPTTIAAKGRRLYAVNARFTTPPTPSTTYNIVRFR